MTDAERVKLASHVGVLFELAGRGLTPPAVATFVRLVSDLPFPAVTAALDEWTRLNRFPPSVAEIREMATAAPDSLPMHNPMPE